MNAKLKIVDGGDEESKHFMNINIHLQPEPTMMYVPFMMPSFEPSKLRFGVVIRDDDKQP